MKLFSSSWVVAAVAGASLSMAACVVEGDELGTSNSEVSATLTGTVEALEFGAGGIIDELLVRVKKGWTRSDAFELDIEITGLNGGPAYHGTDLLQLSQSVVFSTEKDLADVVLSWDQDIEPRHVNEAYTACVQVLSSGEPLGDVLCTDHGPF